MKEGWKYAKVGQIFDTYSGGTPLKSHKEYYENGNIPWLCSGEVCRKYITSTEKYITQLGLDNSSAKYYPENTVVVAMYGATAAQVGILKCRATSNQAVCGILPNDKFLPEFVYNWFLFRQTYLASQAQGGAQPNISQIKIKNIEIPVLSLPEQQQIVDFLDAEFAKIDELKNQAEQSLQNAKDLFQAALKEMLTPKEGWKEERLNNIYNFIDYRGATPTKLSSGVPLVTAKNVRYGYLDYTIKDYISQEEYLSRQSRGISQRGDILFTTEAPLGMVALADLDVFSAGQRLITFQQYQPSKHLLDNKFFLYYFMGPEFQKTIHKLATGATAQGIKASILKEIKVFIPNIQEQLSISEKLDGISLRIQQLQSNYSRTIQLCADLKQALLRQVFE